jgi:hexosaminidase
MPESQPFTIVPRPRAILAGKGVFRSPGVPPLQAEGDFSREGEIFKEQLRAAGFPESREAGGGSLRCRKTGELGPEDYRLCIKPEEILLEASARTGIYRGLQSLRQMLLSEFWEGGLELPCGEIRDGPRFSWRGYMLDCSRYFYSIPFLKKLIDTLSLHHISVFHWHLTDDQGWRLPVAGYPLLTEIGSRRYDRRRWRYTGGCYTAAEIRDLVAFAAARHVEVIPEVDLPGHASAILAAYPGLGCTGGPYRVEDRFGIFEDVLCAGNDGIFDLAAQIFDTLADLFPSPWVHIGGDEVRFNRWEDCPKCKKRLAETGLITARELQSWITVKLVGMLAERGKIAIGWDEILEDSPAYKLPSGAAVMSWRGKQGGLEASRRGHQVVMSSNKDGCYLDYKHRDDPEEPGQLGISRIRQLYETDPADPSCSPEEAGRILGAQANLWSELIYAGKLAEYMTFPRICALAEALWTPAELKDFEDFSRRLPVHQRRLDRLEVLQYRGPLD